MHNAAHTPSKQTKKLEILFFYQSCSAHTPSKQNIKSVKRNLKAKRFEIFEKPTYCIYRSYNCGKMGIEHTVNATYGRINYKYASSPSWNKKNKLPCLRTAALNLHANPWKLRLIKNNSEIWSEKKDIQKNQNNQFVCEVSKPNILSPYTKEAKSKNPWI